MGVNKLRSIQELEVCLDCLQVSANGAPDYEGYEVSGHAERYAVAVKLYGAEPYDSDGDVHFSWNSCEFCGDTLGGDRFTVSIEDMAGA